MGKLFTGDKGTKIRVDVGSSLESIVKVEFKVQKPSGAEVTWTAAVEAPATNGIAVYYLAAIDLDIAGKWKLCAYVEFTDGAKLLGETAVFYVYDKFRDVLR